MTETVLRRRPVRIPAVRHDLRPRLDFFPHQSTQRRPVRPLRDPKPYPADAVHRLVLGQDHDVEALATQAATPGFLVLSPDDRLVDLHRSDELRSRPELHDGADLAHPVAIDQLLIGQVDLGLGVGDDEGVHGDDHRQHDVEDHREQQGVPRHVDGRDAEQIETADRVLLHLFEHQIHHRGQAHCMLTGTDAALFAPLMGRAQFFTVEDAVVTPEG